MTTRRRGSYWALAAAASLGAVLGCSDEAPPGMTADEFAEARNQASAVAKKTPPAAPTAVAAATTPAAKIDPISGVAQIQSGYSYDPTGKRDPFRSFVWDRPDKMAAVAEAGPLGQFDLSQLEVVGVVWRTGNARALVTDPSGESYIVGQGAAIGKNRGRVVSIDDNMVIVKEIYVDYLGQETTKDVEMRMRRNEGG
jgi:type IV pilus assembly protein PilP